MWIRVWPSAQMGAVDAQIVLPWVTAESGTTSLVAIPLKRRVESISVGPKKHSIYTPSEASLIILVKFL
jgi:hypothetical protein